VKDLHTYRVVSQEIIERWPFPYVPDRNLAKGTCYSVARGKIYKDASALISRFFLLFLFKKQFYFSLILTHYREVTIGTKVVFGPQCRLVHHSSVDKSIIGSRCEIKAKAKVTGSFLWDGVIVEEGAVIENALVCTGAKIGKQAKICPGSIIGPGVEVPPFTIIPARTKLVGVIEESVLKEALSDFEGKVDPICAPTATPEPSSSLTGELEPSRVSPGLASLTYSTVTRSNSATPTPISAPVSAIKNEQQCSHLQHDVSMFNLLRPEASQANSGLRTPTPPTYY